ncbi:hypothetical protein EDD16DRAFT_1527652 [Pisolithus croceorrhizus]|nr:hypothetical protein EDD16DRAFT_1527652 [Pisolithus croceorrhizus]
MSAPRAFNITPRMIHLQSFRWFKQFAEGSILMDTALDNIEFALGVVGVMLRRVTLPTSPEDRLCQVIKNLPLSDPGAEDAVPAPLVVQRAMELQGVSLTATCAPALPFGASIHTASTSSPGATRRRHLSSRGGVQRKCRKEDEEGEEEGEEEEEEEKEEDEQEEGGSIHRPQQAEPSGKRSYLQSIDSLCNMVRFRRRRFGGRQPVHLTGRSRPPAQEHLLSSTSSCEDSWLRHYRGFLTGLAAGIDPYFVKETLNLFSAQFWREQDAVEIREGDLRGKKGALTNVDWHKRSAVVWCDDDAFKCTLHELRRVFSLGDTLEIIAGPFCGETGYVVALHEHTIILVVMRPNQTSEDSSHFRRTKPYRAMLYECIVVRMLARQELSSGLVPTVRKGKGKEDSKRDPTPSQSMVAMNASDLHIERAPGTLTLSKDKGYNIAVGDTVEVARGQWRHSQGIVKAVDLIKASLDFVHLEDGIQINIPITFSHKVKEHFDYGLSKFVGCDVWVIGSDKKGTRATLHSLGRMSSWVAIFGQLIELKNNQVAMLTGMLLDGTLLPLQLQCSLKSLHNRSFITPVVPRNVTPPPSPGLSNAGPSDAWSITPDDIIRTQTPDYGEVPWLFQSEFCDFKSFHLGFNARPFNTSQSLLGTLCQPTPPAKINYAWYLRDLKQEDSNSKSVVTEDGTTIQFSDICVAFEYNCV